MLLLCLGPDTFRAQQKARELEAAFRSKYDPAGNSIERLSNGKDAVDEVIERANTVSLFSPRRFLRTSFLLAECPKAKQAALAQALSRDPENVIVVDVEEASLTATAEKAFAKIPKIIKYEFPEQQGAAFQKWVQDIAQALKVKDERAIRSIATATDGDSWLAWNELGKVAAGGQSELITPLASVSIYDFADAYIQDRPGWRKIYEDPDATAQALTVFLAQARAALRVRDGAGAGLHPYVVKKLQGRSFVQPELSLAKALMALLSQRSGLGAEDEATALLS